MESPQASPLDFRIADRAFVAVVDGAFANAAARSGEHLLCRRGCHQCCVGVFAIGPADTLRLQRGLASVALINPEGAQRIQLRAQASWQRLKADFPGDPASGLLAEDREEEFSEFANAEVCPVLDPESGTCDLYDDRPHTCRVFGPPTKTAEGYGVCELCFTHATAEEVVAASMEPEPPGAADALDAAAVAEGSCAGQTIVAFALALATDTLPTD